MITHIKTEQYEIYSNSSIEEMAETGYVHFNVKIFGFWSSDTISSVIRRNSQSEWVVTFSNSSGGRDSKQCDDFVAYKNYASALNAIVDFSKEVSLNCNLEELYLKAKQQKATAFEELLSQDPEMGVEKAKEIVALAASEPMTNIQVRSRLSVSFSRLYTTETKSGSKRFHMGFKTYSKKDLIETLTKMSSEVIVEKV